jgi:hypothetical protein
MRLSRRQFLSLSAQVVSVAILSACGSVGETRPTLPAGTSDPHPAAPPSPTATELIPTPPPATPTPTRPPTVAPTDTVIPSAIPISTREPRPQTPGAQSGMDLQPALGSIPATYFGMHIHHVTTTTPWPAIPFGAWRLWDAKVTWFDLEPRNGEWNFGLLDQYVALAEQHNVDLLLPLGFCPAWASSRPSEVSPNFDPGAVAGPRLIEDWRDYVSTVARRYKGRIRRYEVWNEPNLREYWTGTTKELANLAREAYLILKATDPSVTVVSPSPTNRETGPSWLDDYLAAGGGNWADAIGHHLYVYPSPPEALAPFIGRVRRIITKYGMDSKPLWNTEMGWSAPTVFSSDAQATGYLVRALMLNWAAGVQRCYWYAWDNQEWATLWLTEPDSTTLKPAAIAYAEMEKWLIGARFVSCSIDSVNTYICRLVNDDGSTARVLWNPDRETAYTVPQEWGITHMRDLAGTRRFVSGEAPVQIGPLPIMLE